MDPLPIEFLPVIASHCFSDRGHRMLGVSRAFRDAVFSILKTVTLELVEEDPNMQPLARWLHRICCQASPGLRLALALGKQSDALPLLLQPGLQSGGWPNVTALTVRATKTVVACQVI
jgi:hypothetical protein